MIGKARLEARESDVVPDATLVERLLSDDAAISRMAHRLMDYHSGEDGGVRLASLRRAEELVRSLLKAALLSCAS